MDAETKLELQEAITALTPTQRQAVLLYSQGYTQKEIGEVLGITQGAVSQILRRVTNIYASKEYY